MQVPGYQDVPGEAEEAPSAQGRLGGGQPGRPGPGWGWHCVPWGQEAPCQAPVGEGGAAGGSRAAIMGAEMPMSDHTACLDCLPQASTA